jgi:hypothetical protein
LQTILSEEITHVAVAANHCRRCGAAHADCKSPISHGIPSINNINLPPQINGIAAKYTNGETTAALTAREREIFDATAVMGHATF